MPYAESDGVKIYWEEHGSGPPLLLIMGLGYTLDMWNRALPALAERYRTIVFDNRGVGRSDVPPGPYSIQTMAADARAVMDAAGIDKAHVFGVSMGGMIAQEFALQYARAREVAGFGLHGLRRAESSTGSARSLCDSYGARPDDPRRSDTSYDSVHLR